MSADSETDVTLLLPLDYFRNLLLVQDWLSRTVSKAKINLVTKNVKWCGYEKLKSKKCVFF